MKNRPNAQDALQQAMLTDTVPTGVRGMTDALPNAKGLHKELLALCREREQLATSAGASVAVPTLDAIVQRMQSLDDNVAKHGLALYERLGGQGSQTVAGVNEEGLAALKQMPKPPFQPCDVVDNRKAAKDNKGRPTGPALQQESTAPKWLVPQYPGTFATDDAKGLPTSRSRPGQMSDSFQNHSLGGLQQPLTPEQKNELVRVKDSMELLRGNETGLSMAHIPMSPGLREKIGIPGSLAHQPLPTYRPGMEHFDVEGHFTPEKRIDQAALQPAAHRGAYLRDINQKGFRASLQERSRTELTEEFDNTFMNRTAEALDVVGWAFKGRDKNNWIGPRSERNLERSHYIGKEVDSLTSEVSKNAIYGQHGMAMDQLREVHSLNDIHQGHNDRYEALHQQTQMETGMFLAMLPLSAMGAASSAQKLGQKAMRATSRTATRTAGKTASRATSTTSSRVAGRAATPAMRATQRTARAASPTASKAAQSAAGITDDIATLRKANQGQAASARSVQVDAKGFVSRPNPLEDEFVQRFRKQWPTMKINDDAIRAEFRAGKRFNADGSNLRTLTGDEAFLQRQQEVGELRHSPLFDQDLKARGISQERIKLMDQKKCPLSFDAPETYQEFQADLRQTLKKLELNDSAVTLKGTSTTFYSENPSKPLGHHFDANPLEIADIDLGVSSQKMVDAMKDAGKAAHPKISTIYKTRDTVEVFPELQAFAERWEARLGRPVNFVGLTSGKKPILDPADYLVSGSLK